MGNSKNPKWLMSDYMWAECEMWEWAIEVGLFNAASSKDMFVVARFEEWDYTDCPKCGVADRHYVIEDGYRLKCNKITCQNKFTATSGTYIHDTKISCAHWMRLCYLLGELKFPINSVLIARDLHLTQKTVYGMLTNTKRALGIEGKGINYTIPKQLSDYDILSKLLTLTPTK